MAEDRLIIEGRSFISSIRAAQLFGYTKDYVGQLARAGKIESQLIGRSWYVDEDSIRKHKLSVHYTLTKPKKPRRQDDTLGKITRDIVNEKAIENIDISDEEAVPVHTNSQKTSALETYSNEKRYLGEEEYDLFPRPTKPKTGDVLVKSEFIFEPNPPISYADDVVPGYRYTHKDPLIRDVSTAKTPLKFTDEKKSTLLKGKRQSTFSQRTDGMSGEFVAMDGIVIPGSDGDIQNRSQGGRTSNFGTDDKTAADALEDELELVPQDEYPEDRPTRLIPILGALIIFLLLVVLYLSL